MIAYSFFPFSKKTHEPETYSVLKRETSLLLWEREKIFQVHNKMKKVNRFYTFFRRYCFSFLTHTRAQKVIAGLFAADKRLVALYKYAE